MTTIHDLPLDIIGRIIAGGSAFEPIRSYEVHQVRRHVLRSTSLVCRDWRPFAQAHLWRIAHLNHKNVAMFHAAGPGLHPVKTLVMQLGEEVEPSLVEDIVRGLRGIERLAIHRGVIHASWLCGPGYRDLKVLDLFNVDVRCSTFPSLPFNLDALKLRFMFYIPVDLLHALSQQPSITSLSINYCPTALPLLLPLASRLSSLDAGTGRPLGLDKFLSECGRLKALTLIPSALEDVDHRIDSLRSLEVDFMIEQGVVLLLDLLDSKPIALKGLECLTLCVRDTTAFTSGETMEAPEEVEDWEGWFEVVEVCRRRKIKLVVTENNSQANQGDKGYGAAYGQGYGANQRYTDDGAPKKSKKGLYIGLGVLAVLIAAGAAVGGVLGSRANSKNNAVVAAGDSSGNSAAATKTSGSAAGAIVPTATDALGNPLYPTSTGTAKVTPPAFVSNAALSCGADPYSFGDTSSLTVRKEHPLLVAPAYKWNCLPKLIAQDSYMANWNATIFANASKFYDLPPTPYTEDGGLTGSGVLDVAREVQLRIKHWGYAWRLSNDTKWVDRAWTELLTASGNSTTIPFGTAPDRWNTAHFLDLAEFTAAFAIGYDWMYDAWTPTQRNAIMWSIINLGLNYGELSYTSPQLGYGWWSRSPGNTGNWNGVCNNGLTMGALAIANEDPTGVSARILGYTVPNAAVAVSMAPSSDGTWSETPNYWYFGSTGHAQMAASLLSATGSTHNLLDSNPGMKLSSLYHMYVTGMQGMFNYGDTGPNKFTATANALMFYGSQYNLPMYTLYQRDRGDAPEPMSMLYYDPQVTGVFWDGLALDRYFSNGTDSWVSMRSTWTDTQGTYVAMKAGGLQNHQTHGDLDAGTFVLDAMGERWAGELGNGNYLADAYFSSEDQGSVRWEYYRKATEGQNTLLMGGANQIVTGTPQNKYDSTGDQQNALAYTPSKTSTAYFVTDMSSFYNGVSTKRAIRLINGRRQVLLQDEIAVPAAGVQWRMHTNATVAISNAGKTATLSLNGKTLVAQLQSPATASFSTSPAVRLASDPVLPNDAASQDQPNPGVTVLTITLGAGQQTIQVLFNPQWSDLSANANVSPPSVAISAWTLTSHA